MKTPEEMKKEFDALYSMMASSNNIEFMHTFGKVHKQMFDWFVANKQDIAQEWLDKLESIRWHQYLTQKEAQKIIDGMNPKAPWSRDVWNQTMKQLGLQTEEEPFYNSCALWVEMNKQHSDHAQTLAENVYKKPLADIPADEIIPVIRALAIDLLKDKDGKYQIRKYFNL